MWVSKTFNSITWMMLMIASTTTMKGYAQDLCDTNDRAYNIDFSGAILADVDITHAWLIDIKGTHYFRDLERHDRAPAEGCFTPLAMLDALEQMKDHTKPVHHPGF